MEIIWAHEALERLIDIEDFISKDSPERAAKFVDQIIDHTEKVLSDKLFIGRTVPEIGNPDIRELIFKRYRIVFRLNENTIEILTVFEGHRLLRIYEVE